MENLEDKFRDHKFVCPGCKGKLDYSNDLFSCPQCKNSWPLVEGLADFRVSKDKYWGEHPEEEIDRLILRCKQVGWSQALRDFFTVSDPEYYDSIIDKMRANWHFLVPLDKDARILDAGCGWGPLSFELASVYKEVIAFDITMQRLRFIDLRRVSEDLNNLTPVCGQVNHLPFPDGHFDLVIFNGILEWIPVMESKINPYLAQLQALKEAARVLKKSGYLYLAIENRWSVINFLGFKDAHSHLRFAPLLPRFLADIYSRVVRKKDFREYTHTYWQQEKILKEAGFSETKFYSPLPAYRRFQFILPLNRVSRTKFFVRHLFRPRDNLQVFFSRIIRLPFVLNLTKYFVPDFSIFAKK
ncbi:MAG: methyltransferase domain-containing protein [Candidatus Omnitrophica bacterium]|nr:methyltransferase domain-containing protein [Candidatus Omnitrophota bacterium]